MHSKKAEQQIRKRRRQQRAVDDVEDSAEAGDSRRPTNQGVIRRDQPALRFSPATTKSWMSSDRFIPRSLASLSV